MKKSQKNQFKLLILQVSWYLFGPKKPQVLALPMQLFSLRRLRQRSDLWMARLTEAVHRGGMGSTKGEETLEPLPRVGQIFWFPQRFGSTRPETNVSPLKIEPFQKGK